MESKARSLVKSITWRVTGIILLLPIIYLTYYFIGKDIVSVSIWSTVIFHTLRVILYYIHERIWLKVRWGRAADS
jgi:adenylylsulfate kinase